MNQSKPKVVFIVKYYYPIARPSGISSFLYELSIKLAEHIDLAVVSYKYNLSDQSFYHHRNVKIYKVNKPFPLSVALKVRKLNPDLTFIFSGIYQPVLTAVYFGFIGFLLRDRKKIFCQATNYSSDLKKWYKLFFLDQFQNIISTNKYIKKAYSDINCLSTLIPPATYIESTDVTVKNKRKNFRIGFFGHFYKIKGPDRLVSAFLKINPDNAELVFAGGDGELKQHIDAIATKDDRISLMGYHHDIKKIIASCNIVVLPYRNSQSILGVSQSAIEAMSYGIPIIGTITPSLEPLVTNYFNGFLVDSDDELEEKLKMCINDPGLVKKLGNNARKTIIDFFDIANIKKQYMELIMTEMNQ